MLKFSKVQSPKRQIVRKKSPKKIEPARRERGLVVLDIDGTLIDTVSGNTPRPKYKKRILQFEDHSIYGRPYAKSFIRYLLKKYDVGIWTFATGDYAMAVIRDGLGFDPKEFVFFYTRDFPPPFDRKHDLTVKQIDRIPTPHRKRILIDDNLYNVLTNEKNHSTPDHRAIRVKEYKVHKPQSSGDIELNRVKQIINDRLGY